MNIALQDARRPWRQQAIASNLLANESASLAQLWRELSSGETRILDAFFSDDRCYAALTARGHGSPAPPSARQLRILRGILCGPSQKSVAIELDLAPSTIALNARVAVEAMGLTGRPSRAHPLLTAAAMASVSGRDRRAWLSTLSEGPRGARIISLARPELGLSHVLTEAELSVVSGLVEGLPYTTIARQRGTATRTVANQIAAVFRRLKVSGRSELLQWLFAHQPSDDPLPPPAEPIALGARSTLPPASGAVASIASTDTVTPDERPPLRRYA